MEIKIPYVRNKQGQLVPNIQTSNNPEYDRPIGKYGRMALMKLQETDPIRFMMLQMDGTLQEVMHKKNEQVIDQIVRVMMQLLEANPVPATEDTLVRTRHINQLKSQAEEIVLNDIVG